MKVLIANETYPPQLNGAAVATHRLVQGLAQCGHNVEVVAPNTAFRDEVEDEPSNPGVTVHRIKSFPARPLHPEFRITSWARIDSKVERISRRFQPDIVHVQNHFVAGQACLKQGRKFAVPVVGWGKDEAEFRQLATRLGLEGALVFTGYAPEGDLAGRYSLSDVYIGAGSGGVAGTGRRGGHAHRLAHSGGQPGGAAGAGPKWR